MGMPYCRKCGAELDAGAKYCSACGTPVAGPEIRRMERAERRPIGTLAIVLIVLLVAAAAVSVLAFLPVRAVDIRESRDVPYRNGVNEVNLVFTADVANINIFFVDLSGKLVALNVSMVGAGPLFSPRLYDLAFNYTVQGDALTVTSRLDTASFRAWPWSSQLRVTCNLFVDPSLETSLNVKTSVGRIVFDAEAGAFINSLSLETTTGGVEASLSEDAVVLGDVFVKTTTGGVEFSWRNVIAVEDVLVDLRTTTGGVDVNLKQDEDVSGNVTLKAEATTGGVNFSIEVKGDNGAKIESSTTLGGISVVRRIGFSGTESSLQPENYPASGNFNVNLKTTTGGIRVDARYTP